MEAPAAEFSAATREEYWERLGDEQYDLLVIGGGITGAGVARDAAGRGLSVALLEAGDFGCGTSSRSSRLIHGGLRYLETFDLKLVFEASAERRTLLKIAPHLVHPLSFLFPVYRGEGVGLVKLLAGMWVYDALSLFRNIERHRMLSPAAVTQREPHIRARGLDGGAVYYDAQVDDARLTLAVIRAAHEAGAVTVPRAVVTGFLRDGDAITGAVVHDRFSGAEKEVRAKVVLNATGPWSDRVRRTADPEAALRLRPTKGVHIQVRRERLGNTGALIFTSFVDGRVMFVLPWGDFTYIGTTDTDREGRPQDAKADPADIHYLLDSVNGLFPRAGLRPSDVVSTWSGVRPLLAPPKKSRSTSETSREHEIWRDPNGLLNIAGGKLTTYRVMAAEAVEEVATILARDHGVECGICLTDELPLPGAPVEEWEAFVTGLKARGKHVGLSPEQCDHLAHAYGTDAHHIIDAVQRDPTLAEPILAGFPYLRAEIPHAVHHEMALTLEDLLRRRLHLFYEATDGGLEAAHAIAEAMALEPCLDWDQPEVASQITAYQAEVRKTR
ncbi:MAG TPA: glycerol-3-phosphate dehydrogenase/oxidase [Longimicrobiaceae bacterium]|nr:glycerol-3-phosphate dehydrogenase/oxidase [Longimicrobiaceae bacterium]